MGWAASSYSYHQDGSRTTYSFTEDVVRAHGDDDYLDSGGYNLDDNTFSWHEEGGNTTAGLSLSCFVYHVREESYFTDGSYWADSVYDWLGTGPSGTGLYTETDTGSTSTGSYVSSTDTDTFDVASSLPSLPSEGSPMASEWVTGNLVYGVNVSESQGVQYSTIAADDPELTPEQIKEIADAVVRALLDKPLPPPALKDIANNKGLNEQMLALYNLALKVKREQGGWIIRNKYSNELQLQAWPDNKNNTNMRIPSVPEPTVNDGEEVIGVFHTHIVPAGSRVERLPGETVTAYPQRYSTADAIQAYNLRAKYNGRPIVSLIMYIGDLDREKKYHPVLGALPDQPELGTDSEGRQGGPLIRLDRPKSDAPKK